MRKGGSFMSVPAAHATFNLIYDILIFHHTLCLLSLSNEVYRIKDGDISNINFGDRLPNLAQCPH